MKQKSDRNFTQEKEGQAKKGFSELPRFLGNVKDETRRQDQQKRRAPQQESYEDLGPAFPSEASTMDDIPF